MIFISFDWENCITLRKLSKDFKIQFLSCRYDKKLVPHLASNNFALDVYHRDLSKRKVKYMHDNGVAVNCWTVDSAKDAKRLIKCGVDFITTNVLVWFAFNTQIYETNLKTSVKRHYRTYYYRTKTETKRQNARFAFLNLFSF